MFGATICETLTRSSLESVTIQLFASLPTFPFMNVCIATTNFLSFTATAAGGYLFVAAEVAYSEISAETSVMRTTNKVGIMGKAYLQFLQALSALGTMEARKLGVINLEVRSAFLAVRWRRLVLLKASLTA